ncbi:aminopeptidase P family protein [Marinilabilia rubra]|uniref:Peptidase M24 n=1 Tax=Marinilabilia rubra TaxID=2162893 RepID=A0A2U2BCH0_9BACT|nr:aminopeptidase P family protein [Marinilabilia rubra]PWE00727.1 peptidase M24 [Marinilabilia rubra]
MPDYSERIQELRTKMASEGIDVCIIPGSDAHISEYLSDHWKVRDYLCGFTGSAGTLIVGGDGAYLWTDSRYYLQAEEQLAGTGVKLVKEGLPDVPDYIEWITAQLSPGSKVAINGTCFSAQKVRSMSRTLRQKQIQLETRYSLPEDVWNTQPGIPDNPVLDFPATLAGKTRKEKIETVRNNLRVKNATHYVTGALDEIAWVMNLRGTDISYNPVFHAYLIISQDYVSLFINPNKLTTSIGKQLSNDNIRVNLYNDVYSHLKELPDHATVYIDPNRNNWALFSAIPSSIPKVEGTGIITHLKSIKNNTEVANIKKTMINDGVAMVKFLKWLEEEVPKGNVSELSAAKRLYDFRNENPDFKGESFSTISGYGAHGAIVHYNVSPESDTPLKPKGIYLVDSGGQYPTGTTDLTRTIALGPVRDQVMKDYTLVLKGHIALAKAVFPSGTRGVHLDALARQPLWNERLNFGHGTGHGIGYFLNVHEGPQSIRPQDNGVLMEKGMITSNEPGLYRPMEYGIRIENLVLTKEAGDSDFGTFFEFETLTLCPIDVSLIKSEILNSEEKAWINDYHKKVCEKLSPALNEEERTWLESKTATV